jgi:hypothetical protein
MLVLFPIAFVFVLKWNRRSTLSVSIILMYESDYRPMVSPLKTKQNNQTKSQLREELGAGARRRPLPGLTIPAYDTHCGKWSTVPWNITNLRQRDFCRGGKPWLVKLEPVFTGGRKSRQENCSLGKGFCLVTWLSGNWTQKYRDRFGWWFLRLGRKGEREVSIWLKVSMTGKRRVMPLLNCTLAFALQLRKSVGNLSQCTQ